MCLKTSKSRIKSLSYKDNTFDTVVDTFGLEYYGNPGVALKEMRRVCKKDGLLLIMASGVPDSQLLAYYYRWRQPVSLGKFGKFNTRQWDRIIKNFDFEILEEKRFLNGSVYYYVLRNLKQGLSVNKPIN